MSLAPVSHELEHSALATREGAPPERAALTDRQRMAVMLQAAALLGHLERGGWRLERGWRGARVDEFGLLGSVRALPGRRPGLTQDHLRRILLLLFCGPWPARTGGASRRPAGLRRPRRSIAGRGEARRLARQLHLEWDQRLSPLRPDHVVSGILDRAPFLWRSGFGRARCSLLAVHRVGDAWRHTIVGRWDFARRLRAEADDAAGLEEALRADLALTLWLGGRTGPKQRHAAGSVGRRRVGRSGSTRGPAPGSDRRRRERMAAATRRDRGLERAAAGDLEGAERMLRRGARLTGLVGSERGASVVWQSLAEIRLRLGRTEGVDRYLAEAESATRRGADPACRLRVAALRVRQRLFEGRPEAALERARSALRGVESSPDSAASARERRLLELLAGRALGWLGRATESGRRLGSVQDGTWRRLEAEERALAWLVARCAETALRSLPPGPVGELIRRLVAEGRAAPETWEALDTLAPYRAARAVLDLSLWSPTAVPALRLRRAAAELRATGAADAARRVEMAEAGSWRALKRYAESPEPSLEELFVATGHGDARLVWRDGAREQEIVPGRGGSEETSLELGRGELILSAPRIDEPLAALFAIARRDFRPPGPTARGGRRAPGGIVGRDPGLQAVLERVDRLGRSTLPLLVEGETGTGKELVARRAHAVSERRKRPFLAVNCAALSETLLLADLFGHVRGAFTGADRDRQGVFEAAAGGTVLLDEIGDLPMSAQGKLLRVLQEGEVRRVGESRARRIDVRVIGATHRSLGRMARDGLFREDLYYRLRVGHVVLPPLRERGDDVLLLAASFLAEHGLTLEPEARRVLVRHDWPGNVRELKNVLDVAAAMVDGRSVGVADLELPGASGKGDAGVTAYGYHAQVDALRRRLLQRALAESGGVRAEAARRLGLSRQAVTYLASTLGVD